MTRQCTPAIAIAASVLCSRADLAGGGTGATGSRYLFTYFQSNGETGVFLGVGSDALHIRPANFGTPIFTPPQWSDGQVLTRDPSIIYHDGVFHMTWTSAWTGTVFGYAHSTDLVHWSEPLMIEPFARLPQTPDNCWAPEIDYDPARGDFFIVFSSRFNNDFTIGHRPFIIRTTDFQTFTDPEIYIDPDFSTIDPDQVYDDRGTSDTADDRWVMIYKNELAPADGGLSLWLAKRDRLMQQPWDTSRGSIVGGLSDVRPLEPAEGPSIIRDHDRWVLYWDSYVSNHYSAAVSTDLETWTDATDQLRTPVIHPLHGTVLPAPIDAVLVPMPTLAPIHEIYNGDFEEAAGDQPRNWGTRIWAGSASFTYEPVQGIDGGACVKIQTNGGDLAWGTHAVVEPFARYRLSGWIKTQGVNPGSGLGVQLNVHAMDGVITESLTGTNDWTYVEIVFDNDMREDLQVNCLVGGWGQSSGTAWFDDIRLELACPSDINHDGVADEYDVLEFIGNVEDCP
ncbi:MAG: family 43 glycosylhydrolase [Phycisphaeraceae bacterium]|nr:MAG: family 43 glycosylhydrolase [Phycisphaeraceae bacterium]